MHKRSLAERLLARVSKPARAAAIMGDLAELAATRGRLWFWAAYARTVISLGWRRPAAFLMAIISVRIMVRVYPMWVQHAAQHLPAQWQVGMFYGQLAVASGPFLNAIAMCLWFALPFVWMRFGLRDRLTQSACVLFVSTFPVLSFQVWLIDVSSILTVLIIFAALFSPRWRSPFVVLALTFVSAIASVVGCFRLLAISRHDRFQTFLPTRGVSWLTTTVALAIAALVCSLLHRWLLDRPESPDRERLAGVARV